jgi:hypothetical protein
VYLKRISIKQVWITIALAGGILAFSYNAFSYDLFNYIFDAKIITHYHQNPYIHKALDFPGDPMLSFMQWTHRTYPYGPLWLGLTLPISYIGSNIFLLTFFLFKFLLVGCYIGSSFLIWKINQKILPQYANFNLVLFALNPLVIIETLVSSHNDTAMILFALLGVYLFFIGKKIFSLLFIFLSAMIKIPTLALLAPVLLSYIPMKEKLSNERYVWGLILTSVAALLYVLTKLEMQPWYFLWILPLACIIKPNKYTLSLIIGFSLGLLLRYTPFIYSGDWNGLAPQVKGLVSLVTPAILLITVLLLDKSKIWKRF